MQAMQHKDHEQLIKDLDVIVERYGLLTLGITGFFNSDNSPQCLALFLHGKQRPDIPVYVISRAAYEAALKVIYSVPGTQVVKDATVMVGTSIIQQPDKN